MEAKKNILVIKLGALGDFIQALGPMAAIRRHHPHDRITLLTTKPFEAFARESGYFDEVILDGKPRWYEFKKWIALRDQFHAARFDRVYDLQNNDRTGLYFKLFIAPKPEWVGIAKGASHQNTSPDRTKGHAFEGHVQTLGLAGIKNIEVDTLDWMQADLSQLDLKKPYVLIVPGSAPQHPQKRWPSKQYGELAVELAKKGYQPVIIGTKIEQEIAGKIISVCKDAYDLTGKTGLKDIVVLARGAAAAIGNDTGPMHMIGPTGCPSVVLFSSYSNPVKHRPKGANVDVIQVGNLEVLEVATVLKKFKPRQI